MRVLAMILGILGTVAAFIGAVVVLTTAGIGGLFDLFEAGPVAYAGLFALLFSLLALVGSLLTLSRPLVGAVLMFISALGGLAVALIAYVIATILLVAAGIVALMAPRERRYASVT